MAIRNVYQNDLSNELADCSFEDGELGQAGPAMPYCLPYILAERATNHLQILRKLRTCTIVHALKHPSNSSHKAKPSSPKAKKHFFQ